jgi:tetratricopeptide (TPR) repeat protein
MDLLKHIYIPVIFFVLTQNIYGQNSVIDCYQQSYKLENEGKYMAAIGMLKRIKADTYAQNLRLGWLYYLAGQYRQGLNYYAKAIHIRPNSIEAKLGYVLPAAKLKMWKQVGDQYDAILQIDPNNYKANYYRGLIYYNTGNYKKAAQYINRLVNLYPFDYDAVILAGWNTYYMKNINQAKALFYEAKLIRPSSESATQGLKICK